LGVKNRHYFLYLIGSIIFNSKLPIVSPIWTACYYPSRIYLERTKGEDYTRIMKYGRCRTNLSYSHATAFTFFLAGFFLLTAAADPAWADPDVYASLPDDTRVIQYDTGDLDGDSREELAVLFTSGENVRLALFRAHSGYWSPWWRDKDLISKKNGSTVHSVELADTNGDGIDEILVYYLTPGDRAMAARILAVENGQRDRPSAKILLEDMTSPPGYPLLGTENGSASVTFMKIPLSSGDIGYRRVYCWEEDRFERCVEVPWIKP
jgi:hypothetical protein